MQVKNIKGGKVKTQDNEKDTRHYLLNCPIYSLQRKDMMNNISATFSQYKISSQCLQPDLGILGQNFILNDFKMIISHSPTISTG